MFYSLTLKQILFKKVVFTKKKKNTKRLLVLTTEIKKAFILPEVAII